MNSKRVGSWLAFAAVMTLTACASTGNPTPTSSVSVGSKKAGPGASGGNEQVRALGEMDSLRREVAMLRDQVEVQENELDKMRKRQRELYDDLDYRLRARERISGPRMPVASGQYPRQPGVPGSGQQPEYPADSQAAMGSQTGPAAPGTNPAGPVAGPQPGAATGESSPATDAGSTTAAVSEQSVGTGVAEGPAAAPDAGPEQPQAPTQVAVATAAEQAAYDAAFEMLKQGRYGEAIAAFENMVVQYPNGALADDSQYWVGEAWYVTRAYERALGVFKEVVRRFPDSPRVPEALLKIGYVQQEVGSKSEACKTFSDVINRYPGSRVAISAQTKRKRLELDGHCS